MVLITKPQPTQAAGARLFDLMWLYPLSSSPKPIVVQNQVKNTAGPSDIGLAGAILYPALLTPAIVVGRDWIELLIAFDGKGIKDLKGKGSDLELAIKLAINRQLKTHHGSLNVGKYYREKIAFGGADWADHIKIKGPLDLTTDPIETLGFKDKDISRTDYGFSGCMQPEFIKVLKKKETQFDQIYQVSVDSVPLFDGFETEENSRPRNHFTGEGKWEVTPTSLKNFDYAIHTAAGIKNPKLPGGGQYAFALNNDDVEAGKVDWANPLQAYHPVFAYEALGVVNVGFLADVHVNSRQQVLARSPACVIEHDDYWGKPIGKILSTASKCTLDLLDQFGATGATVVVLGGDLVDFMNNVVLNERKKSMTVIEVWDAVDMDGRKQYTDYVDFVAFYGLVTYFINRYKKPLFTITGNHDCYYEPYGISPRILNKRANDGIPWDHNLTIYEAILAFGPSYAKLLTPFKFRMRERSSFLGEKLSWFYTAFTPFSDYLIRLPQQYLVALGWGTQEEMSSIRKRDQGILHLPRANTAVSAAQLKLLKAPLAHNETARQRVLVTHFNFVSYDNEYTNAMAAKTDWGKTGDDGNVYYQDKSGRNFSDFDLGTFHLHRPEVYRDLLLKQEYQIILTGHSHRRAFYTLREDQGGLIKTGFYDYPHFVDGKPHSLTDQRGVKHIIPPTDQKPPYVIVSDSGGSIPRINLEGEFAGGTEPTGWGSDVPAGTLVTFLPSGDIAGIMAERVSGRVPRAKPRFVVALDYLDVVQASPVIKTFATGEVDPINELPRNLGQNSIYHFELVWADMIAKNRDTYNFGIKAIKLYYPPSPGKLRKMELTGSNSTWSVPPSENENFKNYAVPNGQNRGATFISIFFSAGHSALGQYDYETPWTFEVELTASSKSIGEAIGRAPKSHSKAYALVRRKEWCEIPDFKNRRKRYESPNPHG